MWTKATAERLRTVLACLTEKIETFTNAGNHNMVIAYGSDLRRVEMALARITLGRVG